MNYESSYDTGSRPYNHDKNRGKWSSSKDFFFACIGHAFKPDAIYIMPAVVFQEMRIFALVPYFIVLGLCVVPIMVIQSFLGQFSGTGFISVFRIAPLFKGMGYVSLVVNWVTLTYYSVLSAIPLFYFMHSLRPTIPWSCEGIKSWMNMSEYITPCTYNASNDSNNNKEFVMPSLEFFRNHFHISDDEEGEKISFSWQIMFCTFVVWGIVTFVLTKPAEEIGRLIRYSFSAVIAIMSVCLLRFIFLPGSLGILLEFFSPWSGHFYMDTWLIVPILALSSLGPGWGSILTMASYNPFKTNIYWYSSVTCLAQVGMMIGLAFLSMFMRGFIESFDPDLIVYVQYHSSQWTEFLVIPTGLPFLEMPHFWSLAFFGMIVLGSLNLLVVQLFSVLSSIFDEFEDLRQNKRKVTFISTGSLALASTIFCSRHGIYFFETLAKYSIATQMILNLLMLLVVLWIYGRERFQRDISFMTSRPYSTWMVNIVRFVTPVVLLLGLLTGLLFTVQYGYGGPIVSVLYVIATMIFLLPWCLIPGYCFLKVKRTTGIIGMRLRRCCRPTDWYPADPVYKQIYEETFTNTQISHQLTAEHIG